MNQAATKTHGMNSILMHTKQLGIREFDLSNGFSAAVEFIQWRVSTHAIRHNAQDLFLASKIYNQA